MEADWEVEVGADSDAAVIDGAWAGWVDLLREPERVREIAEVRELPELAEALVALNGAGGALWTAKCDVWRLDESADFDADEMDAEVADARCAWACYLDLLPRVTGVFESVDAAVAFSQGVIARLRAVKLRACRVDVVTRAAIGRDMREGYAVTAYLSACGAEDVAAKARLGELLGVFQTAVRLQ